MNDTVETMLRTRALKSIESEAEAIGERAKSRGYDQGSGNTTVRVTECRDEDIRALAELVKALARQMR